MRGIASTANDVTPCDASARVVSGSVSGARKPISTLSEPSRPMSSVPGARTTATTSADQASPIVAPASSYSESGWWARSPAPDSTTTSTPNLSSRRTTSGTMDTRVSPWAD
jgi:hypothetical protein